VGYDSKQQDFLHHCTLSGCTSQTAIQQKNGVKWQKHEAHHPPTLFAEVRNTGSYAYMATLPKSTEVPHLNNIITLKLVLKHIY
jgi:hypothetical protein